MSLAGHLDELGRWLHDPLGSRSGRGLSTPKFEVACQAYASCLHNFGQ